MIIDIRSDTVTQPTDHMRTIIANAAVGDDVFSEDPTVNELEQYGAELLGKEAALFVPSGTMGNQICLALHSHAGDEAIVEGESHIFHYETGAPSLIARVQLHCVASKNGEMNTHDIEYAIRPGDYYFPRTAVICLENSHNRHGGTILSLQNIAEIATVAQRHSCGFHCDGARLWNVEAATGISIEKYAAPFDTLSVCLSKGLGAPVGSLIVGTLDHIKAARKWRKMLGGGMRQAGILAAAGLHALKHHRTLLPLDHEHATMFAMLLNESEAIEVTMPQTNIVLFKLRHDTPDFVERCKHNGILISRGKPGLYRAVFHFQISRDNALKAAEIIRQQAEKHT